MENEIKEMCVCLIQQTMGKRAMDDRFIEWSLENDSIDSQILQNDSIDSLILQNDSIDSFTDPSE